LILGGLEVQAAMLVSTFNGNNENWTVSGMATLSHENSGGKIYCNLLGTHPHIDGLRDTYIYRLEFDPTTLKGPFWAFLKSYNTLTKQFVEDEFVSGELTATSCKSF
jgi:hypothetical protein